MPINVPKGLPAISELERENIFVMDQYRAEHQDIRPLEILILNLMPIKDTTEMQLLRLLSNSPLQINVQLLHMSSHQAKNTPAEHLESFYHHFDQVRERRYDGLIITGAPVEKMPFERVDYWPELKSVMDWSKTNVFSTLHICWGAQAGLYHHFGVPKVELPEKLCGVFRHECLTPEHPLLRGMDDEFWAPHSRYTEVRKADLDRVPALQTLVKSCEAGVFLCANRNGRQFFVMGHLEYDRETLGLEYRRDLTKGLAASLPQNYFPDDDPAKRPRMYWHTYASQLFSNWLNYFVYQETPYDLAQLGGGESLTTF